MEFTFEVTLKIRKMFLDLMEDLSLEQFNTIPGGFNNNIFWNIKHVVVTQQRLVYGLSQLPLLITEAEERDFQKGTKPVAVATAEDVSFLKQQLLSTLESSVIDYKKGIFTSYKTATVSSKTTLTTVEEAMEYNNVHEGMHLGYVLALKRLI